MVPVRVLVADGQLMFAEALVRVLRAQPHVEVIDVLPTTGRDTLATALVERPNVVFLDGWIPGLQASACIEALVGRISDTRVVVLSWLASHIDLQAAIEAGAVRCVGKGQGVADVIDALHFASDQKELMDLHPRSGAFEDRFLTPREIEILELLSVLGHRNRVVKELSLSQNTLRIHIQNIMRKLDARSQLEAVAIARRRGIVSPARRRKATSTKQPPGLSGPGRTTTVLLVDGQRLFAETVGEALAHEPWLEVLPIHPRSADEALSVARSSRPDVIVLDYWLPDARGAELTTALLAAAGSRVLLTSWLIAPGHVREGLRAGAAGFLPKQASLARLIDAVGRTARGDPVVYGNELAEMLDGLERRLEAGREARARLERELSGREIQVLRLSAIGRSASEIAQALGIRQGTVKVHMRSLRTKLEVGSVAEAVVRAERCGFITVL